MKRAAVQRDHRGTRVVNSVVLFEWLNRLNVSDQISIKNDKLLFVVLSALLSVVGGLMYFVIEPESKEIIVLPILSGVLYHGKRIKIDLVREL